MRTFLDVMLPESNKSLSRQGLGHSLTQSGHAVPFSPQDFCSPCEFVHRIHSTSCRHHWLEATSLWYLLSTHLLTDIWAAFISWPKKYNRVKSHTESYTS